MSSGPPFHPFDSFADPYSNEFQLRHQPAQALHAGNGRQMPYNDFYQQQLSMQQGREWFVDLIVLFTA